MRAQRRRVPFTTLDAPAEKTAHSADEHDSHVHDVSARQPGADQSARALEEMIRVVRRRNVSSERPFSLQTPSVATSATAPAASVGPSSPSVPPLKTVTPDASTGPSLASSASTNSWFRPPFPDVSPSVTVVSPAEQDARGRADWGVVALDAANDARHGDRELASLALDACAQVEHAIAERLRLPVRGVERDAIAADDAIRNVARALAFGVSG